MATAGDALGELPINTGSNKTCPCCGEQYIRDFPGPICWFCDDKDRKIAELRIARRRVCGLGRRHAKLLSWDDLSGPAPHQRALGIVRNFVTSGDALLGLIGKRGRGKTQFGAVAVWTTIEAGRSARIIPALGPLSDLKRRYNDNSAADSEWITEWSEPHLVVIDEITELVGSDHSRAMLSLLIDERYRACRPTILIGNLEPSTFAACVGDSVADRCREGGGLVVCDWESFRVAREPDPASR